MQGYPRIGQRWLALLALFALFLIYASQGASAQVTTADEQPPTDTAQQLFLPLVAAGAANEQAALTTPLATDANTTTMSSGSDETVQAAVTIAGCPRVIVAKVVALDQPFSYNRLGATNPAGMIYALRKDVVNKSTKLTETQGGVLSAGQVALRSDKRPRPLTLRVNAGDCLQVQFQNLLSSVRAHSEQPTTRAASVHINGLQLVTHIASDGSNVGKNVSSLVTPGKSATYTYFAKEQGTYQLYNMGATVGADGSGGTIPFGLFGAVNVEPPGSIYYRSQVTNAELQYAITGRTADGHPILNYNAVYPIGHRYAGLPVLKMVNNDEIIHSDLNAIISGFPSTVFTSNAVYPNRDRAFREFTSIFHDEIFAVQAFPQFNDPTLAFTLDNVRDAFAVNYGTGGIGAEVLGNRLGVGPMWNCVDCKYEEFFLTSWAVGDPAMVVDVPANADRNGDGKADPGAKATKALYPDDPSNVQDSYVNDRVIIRNLHIGKEHHIFHLHAHQWLLNPNEPESAYLDSQAIGPGGAHTYEIAYGGGGNRNKTPGDAIYHCHFYPHFAQGMWELWRNHDTLQEGTPLDANGRPRPGVRAYPDGEIAAGTPIPAIVPLPDAPMAPVPGNAKVVAADANSDGIADSSQIAITEPDANADGIPDRNPGFPFYIPGVAGHRPPTPPLDLVDDGGLPRHVILTGQATAVQSPTNFDKVVTQATARQLPEQGTGAEKAAMAFHAQRFQPTFKPDGAAAQFETNGLPAVPGAPFADPCRTDSGQKLVAQFGADNPRIYKAAVFQMDVTLNKIGWHFPQQRMLALWEDILPTLNKQRPPQPLVMRANANDCINFYHTNLVPGVYELDDFQVRTPTDIIGQHIHLVKFDVTAADGAANGWNYEDGTFSPDEVRERIHAIDSGGGLQVTNSSGTVIQTRKDLAPATHPFFGAGPGGKWLGARTTMQRWYADPILTRSWDRGLGTVFTHDHFGPSTHQQVGLYATLLVEPENSVWYDTEQANLRFGTRADGGPTSWRANIVTTDAQNSYREFFLEYSDFQHAYDAGRGVNASGAPIPDFLGAVNPPYRQIPPAAQQAALYLFPPTCPNGQPRPCAEAITADDPGTYVVNYRNEPIGARVFDPAANAQASGAKGDLATAFSSQIGRADSRLNQQPTIYPPLSADLDSQDPWTPLLRAYQGDKIRVRIQVGGQEEEHTFMIHGMKWLRDPFVLNSGYINSQFTGISEYFHLNVPAGAGMSNLTNVGEIDYLYTAGTQVEDYWNGDWGLIRTYNNLRNDLQPLPSNAQPSVNISNRGQFEEKSFCPITAPKRSYDISAIAVQTSVVGGKLIYNNRTVNGGPLNDPTALIYVLTADLDVNGMVKTGVPLEPLILRANAGECIVVTLRNRLPNVLPDQIGFSALPPIIKKSGTVNGGIVTFNMNDVKPSSLIGLHPQLLAYDGAFDDGFDAGENALRTIPPGAEKVYKWYAGDVNLAPDPADASKQILVATPIEFGAINLMPADRIKQGSKGLIGALIVEPQGSTWTLDSKTRAAATIALPNGSKFREFVIVQQDNINMRLGNGNPVPNVAGEGPGFPEDPQDSGQSAINYRSEPLWFRLGVAANTPFNQLTALAQDKVFANVQIGNIDPQTPIFLAQPGAAVRVRLLQPDGHARGHTFVLHGHLWQDYPWRNNSTVQGSNPNSTWDGSVDGFSAGGQRNLLLDKAGGQFAIQGDYLYRDIASFGSLKGLWGLFRVTTTAPVAADAEGNEDTPPINAPAMQQGIYLPLIVNGQETVTAKEQ